jgi:hypothetical protein
VFLHKGLSFALAAVMLGDTVAEALSCFFIYILYKLDIKKVENKGRKDRLIGYLKPLSI